MTRHASRPNRSSFMRMAALSVAPCLSLILAAGCGISPTGAQSDGRGNFFGFGAPAGLNAPPNPFAPTAESDDNGAGAALREIEEADILKHVDDRIYVLNQFKGLIIIDVTNPDAPAILGRLAFAGRPVEMYIVDQQAFVITSSDVYYGGPYPVGVASDAAILPYEPPSFSGSKLAVIDVADATAPKSMGDIQLVGYATASRRVGDVIYVVGTDVPYLAQGGSGNAGAPAPTTDASAPYPYYTDRAFCASINVADPANITPVERVTFDGSATALHVSNTALFSTSSEYDNDLAEVETRVQYVDISDAAGDIVVRGSVDVPGSIRNRFYLDDFEGVLRITTESFGFGFQQVRSFTYDLADPDDIQPLGSVNIIQGESLEAVRYDGPRGYAVTFLRKDPLFVLDLSDPANPSVSGQLDVPGYSTHIEPRGDRLIAVGIDDTDGNRPAVALYDVSDPATPTELTRIILGPPSSYTGSAAVYDEKAFKIIDELGLIAIPFNYYDSTKEPQPFPTDPPQADGDGDDGDSDDGDEEADDDGNDDDSDFRIAADESPCVDAVQLIDFTADQLVQRGWFRHVGQVERVGVVATRVFAMSQLGFQVVNIDDRDDPQQVAFVPFITTEELPYFNGCGYYYPGPGFPGGGIFPDLDTLIFLLSLLDGYAADGTCGVMSPMPVAFMALGLASLTASVRRRSRRRLTAQPRRRSA